MLIERHGPTANIEDEASGGSDLPLLGLRNDDHPLRFSRGTIADLGRIKEAKASWRALRRLFESPQTDEIDHAAFCALPPEERNARKGAEGFVAGATFAGSRRQAAEVKDVRLLFLDADHLSPTQFALFKTGAGGLAAIEHAWHTTRSHTPESPRVRIIVPLRRPVAADEASALGRVLASQVFADPVESISCFDDAGFRPAQLAYLPTASSDQAFEHGYVRGALADADAILSEWSGDWTDPAQLPRKPGAAAPRASGGGGKMEDPRAKRGVIGAFCRAYGIEEAIATFLPGVYEPVPSVGSAEQRYSYVGGTAAGGMIVYDDLRACSYHDSDPIGGRTVNAFDLVRIHRFGEHDEGIPEDAAPTSLPSFERLSALAMDDPAVMAELNAAMFEGYEFEEEDEPVEARSALGLGRPEVFDADWAERLERNLKTGAPKPTAHNLALILTHHPAAAGCIGYNEHLERIVRRSPLRRPKGSTLPPRPLGDAANGDPWADADTTDLLLLLSLPEDQGGLGMEIGADKIERAIDAAARANAFNPVRNELERHHRAWVQDGGRAHGPGIILKALGLEDTPYHRDVWANVLTAIVARTFEPGTKFDYMVVLQGAQGSRKSTLIELLALGRYRELASRFDDDRRMAESTRGALVVECSELGGFRRSESEDIKAYLSRTVDRVRHAYARHVAEAPRRFVLIGSTNEEAFLKDASGNRRFWPLQLPQDPAKGETIDIELVRENLWAIFGWAVQNYRDLRAASDGQIDLSLRGDAASMARRAAEAVREPSQPEILAEVVAEHLERPFTRAQIETGEANFAFPDEAGGGARYRRCVASAREIAEGIKDHPFARGARSLPHDIGRAMQFVDGWKKSDRKRKRAGRSNFLYVREGHDLSEGDWGPVEPKVVPAEAT